MKSVLLSLVCAAAMSVVAVPASAQSYSHSNSARSNNTYVQRDGTVVVTDRYGHRTSYRPAQSNRYDRRRNSYSNSYYQQNGRSYVRDRYGNFVEVRDNRYNNRYDNRYDNRNQYNQDRNYYYGSRYVRHNGQSYDQCSSRDRNKAAALGLVIGGVIGNQVSDSPAGTALGAIIGGAVARSASKDRRYCD